MPSKKRRTRRRRSVEWTPVLWIACVVNLVAGLLFSPLTKAQVVWVEGAPLSEREAIRSLVQLNRGIPGSRVNRSILESRILDLDPIDSVQYSQNLFGRGLLKITPKVAVARVRVSENGAPTLFSAEGTPYRGSVDRDVNLPELVLPADFKSPTLSPLSRWENGRIADLCQELSQNLSEKPVAVEVTERGVIQLIPLDGGARVVLGSSDGWEKKIATLTKMLAAQSDLWQRYSEVNLIDPDSPMTRR